MPLAPLLSTPERLRALLTSLPSVPGVYQMRDAAGTVIYVGKAISLHARVRQYFQGNRDQRLDTLAEEICDVQVVPCATEREALALECTLIKRYRPRFNIHLKDDKGYIVTGNDVVSAGKWSVPQRLPSPDPA